MMCTPLLIGYRLAKLAICCGCTLVAALAQPGTPIDVPAEHQVDNKFRSWKRPTYPVDALSSRTGGKVIVEFDVAQTGEATNVRIVDATPPGIFDASVMASWPTWRIFPYRASACCKDFPRSQVAVTFHVEKGEGKVSISEPSPLAEPCRPKSPPPIERKCGMSQAGYFGCEIKAKWRVPPDPWYQRGLPQGDVVVSFTAMPTGTISDIEIIFSLPNQQFGDWVRESLKNSSLEFSSETPVQKPVKFCMPFRFAQYSSN